MLEEAFRLRAIAEADAAEMQERELRRELAVQLVEEEAARNRAAAKIRAALLG